MDDQINLGMPVADDETAAMLNALHEQGSEVAKRAIMEWVDKNTPKEHQISMMNGIAVEILASALGATTNMVKRGTNLPVCNAMLDFVGTAILPEFGALADALGRGGLVHVANDDEEETPTIN